MAIKPTIYKANISINDFDRDYYDSVNLTLALHPSETVERMLVRLLAYCHNAQANLQFTKGLCVPDEPDIECVSDDGRKLLWVDVGEPKPESIKKASRQSVDVCVYSFNTKSDVWWQQSAADFALFPVKVYQFNWDQITELAKGQGRSIEWVVSLSSGTLSVTSGSSVVEVDLVTLQ